MEEEDTIEPGREDPTPIDDDDERRPLLNDPRGEEGGAENIPMEERGARRRTTTSVNYRERDGSIEETLFLEDPREGTSVAEIFQESARQELKSKFPRASPLVQASYEDGRLKVKFFGKATKYPLFTENRKTGEQRLHPNLPKETSGRNDQEISDLNRSIAENEEVANDPTASETEC